MDSCSQALGPDIDVNEHALGFSGKTGVCIGHTESHHFVGTSYDARGLPFLFVLGLCDTLEDGRVV